MKKRFLVTAWMLALPTATLAQPHDIIGGPDASTQTIHHCGFLPTTSKRYTTSPLTTRIVEHKLSALGYGKTVTNTGRYSKGDQKAVRKFQSDHGLAVDGIVGPITAQHLAFESHPSANVHRCYGRTTGVR